MSRQTQTSLFMIIVMAGTVGLVAFVALMVVGEVNFSPALFFATLASLLAGIALFVGLFRDDDPAAPAAPMPRAEDRTLTAQSFEPGNVGLEPGTAGVPPGSAGRTGPGATTGKLGFDVTEGDKPSTAAEAPGPAHAGNQAGNAPSSAHGGMPSGDATSEHDAGGAALLLDVTAQGSDRPAGATQDPAEGHDEVTIGTEPPRLGEAREGGPDDLTRIDGVTTELEAQLHKLGVFHFDQVAAWNRHDVVWIEESLGGLDGRVGREDWTGQARSLAEGPEAQRAEEGKA